MIRVPLPIRAAVLVGAVCLAWGVSLGAAMAFTAFAGIVAALLTTAEGRP